MKANLFALLTTLFITHLSLSARIEVVRKIDGYEPISVSKDESFRLIYFDRTGADGGNLIWQFPSVDNDVNETAVIASSGSYRNSIQMHTPIIIEGPGALYLQLLGSREHCAATVEILPTSEMQKYLPGGGGSSSSSSASGDQKNVTVIPENTPSNVQITLEQSTDLVNWSVVQPGSFAPSTTKRFFRIRSEQE